MSEEQIEEQVEEQVEEVVETPTQESIEDVAKQLGWNENFEGDGALSAKEFILNSRKIMDSQNKNNRHLANQVSSLRDTINEIQAHNEAVYKAEVSRLKRELDDAVADRDSAIKEGDTDAVKRLDKRIQSIQSVPQPRVINQQSMPPEFIEWHEKNPWYGSDQETTAYADGLREDPRYGKLPYERMLKKIESDTKAMFPDKFPTKKPDRETPSPSPVEGARPKRPSAKKYTMKDLSERQQKIARDFEAAGVMTFDEYVADLKKTGVLS